VTTRTRFAPSPTGDLHLGSAWTALASWVTARRAGGRFVLRIEDLDPPRVVPGAEARIEEDLRWLGLDWDEGPVRQSERGHAYEAAIAALAARGLVYPCDCSRAEIALVANAPHPGDESVYPGTCRDRDPSRKMRRPPSLRVRVPDEVMTCEDAVFGRVAQNLALDVGDFVLRRGDGPFAYQLAVVVDDMAAGITDVVRGADLVGSIPRQAWLMRELGAIPPRYTHVPLVVAEDGVRLEKRRGASAVRALCDKGIQPTQIIGSLAHGLGIVPANLPATPDQVARASVAHAIAWRRDPWPVPGFW
jgi:glutamyl-tRNA synthetase